MTLDALDDLAPSRQRLRTPDGAELEVVVAGPDGGPHDGSRAGPDANPPVVLVHCWTGDRRVWGPVARRLVGRGRRVVLYDHRGHGRSTLGTAALGLDVLADDLRAVLEHLDVRQATLAGHSLGGMTVQALAGRHRAVMAERVGAVALVSTAATAPMSWLRRRVGPAVVGHQRTEALLGRPRIGPLAVRDFVGRHPERAHLTAITETFRSTSGPVRRQLLAAIAAMDLTANLAALSMPVTVVVGSRDRHTRVRHARQIAAGVGHARLVVIPDAGHMLPLEAPDVLAGLLDGTAQR